MKLLINDKAFDVDMNPLRQRAIEGMLGLIQDKSKEHGTLRHIVKGACTMALGWLGIEKKDRNDDPIELVALFIADHIFQSMERGGLVLTGTEMNPPIHLEAPKTQEQNG